MSAALSSIGARAVDAGEDGWLVELELDVAGENRRGRVDPELARMIAGAIARAADDADRRNHGQGPRG